MCDTIVALGSVTKTGITLFGKNSDREPDEVQNIKIYPRQKHKRGEKVKCTYLTIPQVTETARIMLCQPFWMFGAEMGANEHGVAIGNEALFTREKPDTTGLTGMDLLRLALERSRTAKEALEVIIELLEKYGQGGNCGYRQKLLYMNSFLIADSGEAYVLETVKSWWAWKQIKDFWSISNIISLENDFDVCSPGLIENAVKKGYCKSEADFSFRKCYSDKIMTWGARGAPRQTRSREMLSQKNGALTTVDFMAILRDHGGNADWTPDKSGGTICMHAADKLIRRSQSVCSMVANIGKKAQFYYTTGAANPCMSPYYPILFPDTVNPAGYVEGDTDYDTKSFWWECERFHRQALWHFRDALKAIQPQIKKYENGMISSVENAGVPLNQKTIDKYFTEARTIIRKWGKRLDSLPVKKPKWLFRRYWQSYNKLNRL
ncbi:MAG: C69 family dipeptidase [Chloroflexota bacterium]|nr:MAG: C69 family dipeptidase [Chloroflexota bacterium]